MITSILASYTSVDIVFVTGNIISRDPFVSQAKLEANYALIMKELGTLFPTTQIYVSVGVTEFGPTQMK